MAKENRSLPENRKEVFKFWLGFFEKIAVLISAVAIIPRVLGQLDYPKLFVLIWTFIICFLLSMMIFLSYRLWYLPQQNVKGETRD